MCPILCNLPGWRWKRIKQLFLVGSSSSLHSEVCNALGGVSASPTAKFLASDMCVRALSTGLRDCESVLRTVSVGRPSVICVAHPAVCAGTCHGVLSAKWQRAVSGTCRVHRSAKRGAEMAPRPFPQHTCSTAESGCVLAKSVSLQGGIDVGRSQLADSAARTDPGWKQSR